MNLYTITLINIYGQDSESTAMSLAEAMEQVKLCFEQGFDTASIRKLGENK